MTFFSLILALLIEQARPLPVERWVRGPLLRFSGFLVERFNDGQVRSGQLAWCLSVGGVFLAAWLIFALLWWIHPLLGLVFNLVGLYWALGFRQESDWFSEIHLALRLGELERARELLGHWRGGMYLRAGSSEISRLAIEQALLASHRRLFGVLFWFALLPGPSGALAYRLAQHFDQDWGGRQDAEIGAFGVFARKAFGWIDWLPVRLTAVAYSIVGDFEGAVYSWRTQAGHWANKNEGVLLAAGAGGLGVRLGLPVHEAEKVVDRPELGSGRQANVEFMQSAVGLVWRALVLCLLMLALVAVAGWVGA